MDSSSSATSSSSFSGATLAGGAFLCRFRLDVRPRTLTMGSPVRGARTNGLTQPGPWYGAVDGAHHGEDGTQDHPHAPACVEPTRAADDRFCCPNHRARLPMLVREESGFQLPLVLALARRGTRGNRGNIGIAPPRTPVANALPKVAIRCWRWGTWWEMPRT